MLMGCVGRNCGSCTWWERQGPQLAKATRDPSAPVDTGTCQAHAPVVMQTADRFPVSLFPVTHETRCCGEWKAIGGSGPDDGERAPSSVTPFRRAA